MSDAKSIVTWGFAISTGGYHIPHIMTDGLLDTAQPYVPVVVLGFQWFRRGWFSLLRRGSRYA